MEKPILVALGRDSPDDLVEYKDPTGAQKQRMGLLRCVPYAFIDKPFNDLVKYICDPAGADGNPAYEGSERELAMTYMSELSQLTPEDGLYAKRGGVRLKEPFIKYTDLVSQHFGRIVEARALETPAGTIDCKSLDLVIAREYSGGR